MIKSPKPLLFSSISILGLAILIAISSENQADAEAAAPSVPATVTIQPGDFSYRLAGEFLKNGRAVDAPMQTTEQSYSIEVMQHLVSAEDYQRCVSVEACAAADNRYLRNRPGLPITGVSYDDAIRYAKWLSNETGFNWRLPSDREWAYYAGERYYDDAIKIEEDEDNPAKRWIAEYERQASLSSQSGPMPRLLGAFGKNRFGLYDIAGNVWEWTDTCFRRFHVQSDKSLEGSFENCGVLVAQGKHRAYISSFIQDAKSGGCAAGVPPDNLGFRLVREKNRFSFSRWVSRLKEAL